MILTYIDLYAQLIVASIFLKFILRFLPDMISNAFNDTAASFRKGTTKVSEFIFRGDRNFERYFSTRLLIPFLVTIFVQTTLLFLVTELYEFVYIKLLINTLYLFTIINILPDYEDLDVFSDVSTSSVFFAISKIAIAIQLSITFSVYYLIILIFPLSSVLNLKDYKGTLSKEWAVEPAK